MRFILILLVALSLTLAWQSSVIAEVSANQSCVAADKDKKSPGKQGSSEEEPECD